MKIIVDTNRIIAALIKDSTSRKILFNENFEFVSPDYVFTEIAKHEEEIIKKARITYQEFEILLSIILERIEIVPKEEYESYIEKALKLIKDIDDVSFIAAGLALKADGIWSDDPHFLEQDEIKIFTTKEMVDKL